MRRKYIKYNLVALFCLFSTQSSFAEFEGEYYTKIEKNTFTKKFEPRGYVRITSLYDEVMIKDIYVNRGNCFSTKKIRDEIRRIENSKERDFLSGAFLLDYKLLLNSILTRLKFGQNIDVPLESNCTIKELVIESDMGVDTLEW